MQLYVKTSLQAVTQLHFMLLTKSAPHFTNWISLFSLKLWKDSDWQKTLTVTISSSVCSVIMTRLVWWVCFWSSLCRVKREKLKFRRWIVVFFCSVREIGTKILIFLAFCEFWVPSDSRLMHYIMKQTGQNSWLACRLQQTSLQHSTQMSLTSLLCLYTHVHFACILQIALITLYTTFLFFYFFCWDT